MSTTSPTPFLSRTFGQYSAWLAFVTALITPPVGTFAAQLIPESRTFGPAWQKAGYPGQIPSPSPIKNVRDFGATGDGITDDRAAISAAISSLGGAPGVVFFPAGNYLMKSTLNVPGGCVLRGERSSNTSLTVEHTATGISVSKGQAGAFQAVVSGGTLHSSSLIVTNGAVFAAGDYAEIREDNDAAWGASDWAPKVVGQILRIATVSGNTITLERPLRITYPASQNPEIRKVVPVSEAGIENIRISRTTAGTATDRDNKATVLFNYAARCWVRGVEFNNGFGSHISIDYSTQISVTGCYIHHSSDYDGGGSGYGVVLEFKSGECLIENNIFRALRHSMLLQAGSNGNVLGYNYSREQQRTEFPSEASADIVFHGNYPYANLAEGNICQQILADTSHGANGPLNTLFRNRAEAYGINITDTLITRLNVVGNETYKGTYSIFTGDGYALNGTDRFEYANNTQSDGVQAAGTTSLTDYSYYLNADPSALPPAPSWWNISAAFPSIGLPLSRTATKDIPARLRYVSGTAYTVAPPSLSRQPASLSLAAGQPATFTVQGTGSPSAQFTWRKNGTPVASGESLAIAAVEREDAGLYDCLITDDFGSVTTSSATLSVTDSFSSWSARKGVADAAGDPDFDGLPNLVEYAIGSDPLARTTPATPAITPDGQYLTLTYTKVKNSQGTTCSAQVSTSLGGVWDSSDTAVEQRWQVTDHGATETITARDRTPVSSSPARFFRLQVTAP